jgi:hypothetical protein
MEATHKTPWKKNLDKRYICGEDLQLGVEMGKGFRPEMLVTVAKFNDAPTYDQSLRSEVTKTAVWFKEYPSGKLLYKPMILNNENGNFLSKEIGEDSIYVDDFDQTKPVIMYARFDKKHGYIVRFKRHVVKVLQPINDKHFAKGLQAIKDKTYTAEKLKAAYQLTPEQIKQL